MHKDSYSNKIQCRYTVPDLNKLYFRCCCCWMDGWVCKNY